MTLEAKTFIALAASVVNGAKSSIETSMDLDALYEFASFHQMTALIAAALAAAGVEDPRFKQEQAKSIRKNLLLDYDRKVITDALEKAGIWYMPLKGVVLREYYPQSWMRQMSDNDILFDAKRADEVKTIMETQGFTTVHFGTGHQDDYQKPPVSHFEMHRMLFASTVSEERLYTYYRDIERKLIAVSGCERRFTDEDFYIYMVAHEYKHFYWNGTGLRSLLDVYVFLKRFEGALDWDYIRDETAKLGLAGFEQKNRELAFKTFGDGADIDMLNAEQTKMLECFANAGVYGNKGQGIHNKAARLGKSKYVMQRVFLPMPIVEANYPFFYKHKILLPVLPIYRLFHGWNNAVTEVKAINKK